VCHAEEVITTAETAGRAILNIYNTDVSKWGVELKSDSSPLTVADKEANRVICENLAVSTV
jgi:3'(2'), 5'-bisphosphate nucleotidase